MIQVLWLDVTWPLSLSASILEPYQLKISPKNGYIQKCWFSKSPFVTLSSRSRHGHFPIFLGSDFWFSFKFNLKWIRFPAKSDKSRHALVTVSSRSFSEPLTQSPSSCREETTRFELNLGVASPIHASKLVKCGLMESHFRANP